VSTSATWIEKLDRLCAVLLLVPFLTLALIPAHAMPALGPDGLTLVLCGGDGPLSDGAVADDRCDWVQAVVDLPHVPPFVAPAPMVVNATVLVPADLTGPTHDPRGVMARGPPVV
jgi:hypothetical protein